MAWKQAIQQQLQEKNRFERDVYAEVVKHCKSSLAECFHDRWWNPTENRVDLDNRLSENYSVTLVRCTEQEREILALRQENNDLQKNSARWADRWMMSHGSWWFYLQCCRSSSKRQSEKLRKWLYETKRWNPNPSTRTNRCKILPPGVRHGWFVILSFLDDQASD